LYFSFVIPACVGDVVLIFGLKFYIVIIFKRWIWSNEYELEDNGENITTDKFVTYIVAIYSYLIIYIYF